MKHDKPSKEVEHVHREGRGTRCAATAPLMVVVSHENNMLIRRAKPVDARGIHLVHMSSIRDNCSTYYTDSEIKAWSGRDFREADRIAAITKDCVFVVEDNTNILGFVHMAYDGRLYALYIDRSILKQGFGTKLLTEVETEARSRGLFQITTDSTLNAVDFYRQNGFYITGQEHTLEINREHIRCVPMVKILKNG